MCELREFSSSPLKRIEKLAHWHSENWQFLGEKFIFTTQVRKWSFSKLSSTSDAFVFAFVTMYWPWDKKVVNFIFSILSGHKKLPRNENFTFVGKNIGQKQTFCSPSCQFSFALLICSHLFLMGKIEFSQNLMIYSFSPRKQHQFANYFRKYKQSFSSSENNAIFSPPTGEKVPSSGENKVN